MISFLLQRPFLGLTALLLLIKWYFTPGTPKGFRLPPCPPPKPIIGNLLDMPKEREWETYGEWAKKYGELVYLNLMGTSMFIINSRQMAHELFDKRSSIYSDRMDLPMLNDVMGSGWLLPFHRYGDRWRRHRRVLHEKFHVGAAVLYRPTQLKRARSVILDGAERRHGSMALYIVRELLKRLLRTPEDYAEHIRHIAGATILESVYAINVKSKDDPFIIGADKSIRAIAEAGIPGTFWVDLFPWLKYIPDWVPGAVFKQKARVWRRYIIDMNELPYQATKDAIRAGTAQSCFVTANLEELAANPSAPPDQETVIKNAAGVIFTGASDTTVNSMITFIPVMILYPEVQRKAQAELDTVVGGDCLVDFNDQPDLPYIGTIIKEVLRWRPLFPQAIAHATAREDIIGEYFIPKGTVVVGNSWGLLHDENDFGPNTDEFIPERFLRPGIRNPANTGAFGYGRRICPGIHFAESPKDNNGKELPVDYEFSSGLLSYPGKFKYSIEPRSEKARELVMTSVLFEMDS
ncbi:hypothetical protein M422DRAFT_270746 [Sphaerobolus stellatus SS14]|uniref:Cytochrome P450 n=1 Tax=Sphaerobolus stellatus (strain SS14) TaxID=990650 RepID=A0A0C9US65_SPHS4|nr:hypothetical protein M422DRAFT_270746 [Sphaerobolus stellatus SS14]